MNSSRKSIGLTVSLLSILSPGFSPLTSAQSSADCLSSPAGLVSWWRGEGNARDSEGRNHGTLQGAVGFAPGVVGQAFVLDERGVVHVPDSPELSFGAASPMTVELWAYRTGTAETMHCIGKRTYCGWGTTELNYQMGFNDRSGEGLFFGAGSANSATNGGTMPLNTWVHLAGVFDGTHFLLYTNAVLAATHRGTLGPENRAPLLIGGSGGCEPFVGLVDEVSLYSRALSAAEVLAIYKAGSAGKCPRVISASVRVLQVEICWDSLPTANYQVQYRSELTTNLWTPLVSCIPGSDWTTCVQDAVPAGEAQRYYRVVLTNCVPQR